MQIVHSERNNSIWLYFHEYFYEIILLVWVQRHQNIALYCRFQNQSQSGKGRELQFQDMSAPELTIFFWFSESTLSLIALKAPPPLYPHQRIFFEVQIHSRCSSTGIKIRETFQLHNFGIWWYLIITQAIFWGKVKKKLTTVVVWVSRLPLKCLIYLTQFSFLRLAQLGVRCLLGSKHLGFSRIIWEPSGCFMNIISPHCLPPSHYIRNNTCAWQISNH